MSKEMTVTLTFCVDGRRDAAGGGRGGVVPRASATVWRLRHFSAAGRERAGQGRADGGGDEGTSVMRCSRTNVASEM